MKNLKLFDLNFAETTIRFYWMMAVVIVFSFLGQFTIAAILGYALAVSFILGVSYKEPEKKAAVKGGLRVEQTEKEITLKKAA